VSTAAVGVAAAPVAAVAGFFQLLSHREPPQTTVCEHCERHKRVMSFPSKTWRTLWNAHVNKRTSGGWDEVLCMQITEAATFFRNTCLF